VIVKVLIDNGSAHMTIGAYDGSPRPIIRNIDVELIIGPQPFQVTL
jgi:hypothetical protein